MMVQQQVIQLMVQHLQEQQPRKYLCVFSVSLSSPSIALLTIVVVAVFITPLSTVIHAWTMIL